MTQVYQTLKHELLMATFAVIGNATEIAKSLDAVGSEESGKKILQIAEYYADQLAAPVEAPKAGPTAVFNGSESLYFGQVKGRFGYDTKTTTKIMAEGIKTGLIGTSGKGRSKKYFVIANQPEPVSV